MPTAVLALSRGLSREAQGHWDRELLKKALRVGSKPAWRPSAVRRVDSVVFCKVPALEGGRRDVSQQTPRQRFGIRRVPLLRVRDLSLSRVTYGGTLGSKASCLLFNIMPDIVYSLQRHVVAGCVCVGRIEEISKAALLPKSMATGPTKMQATALTVGGFKPRRERAKGVELPGTSSSNHARLGYPCVVNHGPGAKKTGNSWPMQPGQGLRFPRLITPTP